VNRYRGVARREIEERLTALTEIPAAVIAAMIAAVFQFTNALGVDCGDRVRRNLPYSDNVTELFTFRRKP
jgi:hypothetical protein